MRYKVEYHMNNNFFNKDTINKIKLVLNNRRIIVEIYVNGKAYIERRDYKKIEEGKMRFVEAEEILRLATPVYGALQLLDLFNERIEKIRIFSTSYMTMNGVERDMKTIVGVNANRNFNVLEIYP